jgi:hypothetical protein
MALSEWGGTMRHIHLSDDMRLRFPARSEEFDLGVEIGVIAALMEAHMREFTRRVSPANIDQARALAEKMGFRSCTRRCRMRRRTPGRRRARMGDVTFRHGQARPSLRLVHCESEVA